MARTTPTPRPTERMLNSVRKRSPGLPIPARWRTMKLWKNADGRVFDNGFQRTRRGWSGTTQQCMRTTASCHPRTFFAVAGAIGPHGVSIHAGHPNEAVRLHPRSWQGSGFWAPTRFPGLTDAIECFSLMTYTDAIRFLLSGEGSLDCGRETPKPTSPIPNNLHDQES